MEILCSRTRVNVSLIRLKKHYCESGEVLVEKRSSFKSWMPAVPAVWQEDY